jgi:hypothetical protein
VLDPDGNKVELWQPMARAEKGDATWHDQIGVGSGGPEPAVY